MGSNRFCWRSARGKDRGAIREHGLLCSMPPGNGCLCARCWPMPSSIPKRITNISGSAGEPGSILPGKPRRGIPRGGIRYQMYRAFPQKEYRQRAQIETIFSVIKRKLSSRAPGRSLPVPIRQALLLGLTYNLYRWRHRLRLRGCQLSHLKPFRMNIYRKTGRGVRRPRSPITWPEPGERYTSSM